MRSACTSGTGSARLRLHHPVALHFAARQREDIPDRVVDVEPVLVEGVLGEGAYPGDDVGALAVGHDPHGGLLGALQVLAASQRTQAFALLTMAPSG